MRRAARRLSRPWAAFDVAKRAMEVIESSVPPESWRFPSVPADSAVSSGKRRFGGSKQIA